jgi:glutamate-ammonia-ligase adenylyltransferase
MSSEVEIINARKMIFDQHFAALEHPLNKGLLQLLISSDYALRHLDVLKKLLAEDEGTHSLCLVDYWQMLTQISTHSRSQFLKDLRQLRHRVLIRLLLREYANEADIIETMASWSDFAEAAILMTISYCAQELNLSYGMPLQLDGLPAKLDILAMGKLGGRELNYSSDIDLIFAFSQLGQTSGPQSIDNVQYYTRLIQQFIQILQQITPEGFVFRVDLRLRPNGESSAVTCSLATMETYYQEQGRDWERYAMVKARLLGESPLSLHWINRLIVPFVYRKYIDFGVIESLRSMKSLIEREVQINPMLDDIKRGSGGIREIEFIIQSIQLIRGGRLPQLRVSNLLAAIDQLEKEKLLKRT